MILTAILNGVKIKRDLPINWAQVTFRQYIDLFGVAPDDYTKILSVFTGVDEETLKRVHILNLEVVIEALSFMKTTGINYAIPKSILGFPIPKDLQFETTGQYKDVQLIAEGLRSDQNPPPPLTKEQQLKYLEIVAVYAMKDYCDASQPDRDAFAERFYNAPCEEVLAVGNFTLLKLIGLNLNIKAPLPNRSGVLKRLRLGIKIWALNTGFSVRYWRLRRLLA